MRRMGVIPRGCRLQFALQPGQRREPFQRQRPVAILRTLFARHHRQSTSDMNGTHRAFGRVLMLVAGAAGAERLEADFSSDQRLRDRWQCRQL